MYNISALEEMCKMIIAMSWRVKVSLSVCVHFKSYYLEVDAVILSKYIFTKHTCRASIHTWAPIIETQKEQQADSLSTQLVLQSSFYLLI